MKNRLLYPIILFVYIASVLITSAGAINYGDAEAIYIVAAIVNGICGVWCAYNVYQNYIKTK